MAYTVVAFQSGAFSAGLWQAVLKFMHRGSQSGQNVPVSIICSSVIASQLRPLSFICQLRKCQNHYNMRIKFA